MAHTAEYLIAEDWFYSRHGRARPEPVGRHWAPAWRQVCHPVIGTVGMATGKRLQEKQHRIIILPTTEEKFSTISGPCKVILHGWHDYIYGNIQYQGNAIFHHHDNFNISSESWAQIAGSCTPSKDCLHNKIKFVWELKMSPDDNISCGMRGLYCFGVATHSDVGSIKPLAKQSPNSSQITKSKHALEGHQLVLPSHVKENH